jgi:glutamyl-tRNA synthetase
LYIEREDAKAINVDEKITLMKWGNVTITAKEEHNGEYRLFGKVDVDDKNFKDTKKLTWIVKDESVTIDVNLVEFDHLITKPKIEEEEKTEDFVNRESKVEYTAIGEGVMRNLQKGDII